MDKHKISWDKHKKSSFSYARTQNKAMKMKKNENNEKQAAFTIYMTQKKVPQIN